MHLTHRYLLHAFVIKSLPLENNCDKNPEPSKSIVFSSEVTQVATTTTHNNIPTKLGCY
jgi:hypothetical protein